MLASAKEIAFRNHGRSTASFVKLAEDLAPAIHDRVQLLLKSCPDPDSAIHYLSRLREEQPAAFQRITKAPAVLQSVITVFCHSRFLAEELLKAPEWIEPVSSSEDLHRLLPPEEFTRRLDARLERISGQDDLAAAFAAFRREQILRILLRDVFGYGSLSDITEELSNLADAILDCAFRRIHSTLVARYGSPMQNGARCEFSIIALGKHGGRELNYSSDIDLLFVYGGAGQTGGRGHLSNTEFFKKLAVQLTEMLSTYTPHGICYRIDLRLRPEGTLGEICVSLDSARSYYQKRARDWELQMLIKARVAAGDPGPGKALLDFVEPLIYTSTLDFSKVEAVSEARHRIHEKLAKRRTNKDEFDIKLAPGGIRDIEFLVQCLQRLHGGREPWVRHGGTLLALFRLWDKRLLSEKEYGRLAAAYRFFRTLEHRLQFWEDRQTHVLPSDADELELLARRTPTTQLGSEHSPAHLKKETDRHLEAVKEIYERVVHTRLPLHYTERAPGDSPGGEAASPQQQAQQAVEATPSAGDPVSVNLGLRLKQKAPGLAATLDRSRIRYGARALEHFIENLLPNPGWIEWLNQDPVLTGHIIDLFEHSPYFAEELNRRPELVEELREMRQKPRERIRYDKLASAIADMAELRRFYSREMLRVQAESICLRTPVFDTLQRTSSLADCAVSVSYRLALQQVVDSQPPKSKRYKPKGQMMLVALGRLGMQEFDLGSDADIVFVLPDGDASETLFWTRVAERSVEVLTAYTGDGTLFAVDTRLRPNGREGPLVQTEQTYKDYFAQKAEAWEGITYMKSRAVAGNVDRGTKFLNELQEVDWRRYGQGGRSKSKLRQMRLRLESEQGAANPLKAGTGGAYDIDFALMYLRLKSAGIFFRALTTPERIDVIEKMGHLEPADARFLLDAATFYRAVDHGLRLISGHAEGKLPSAKLQLEMLTDLVGRWTPDHLHDQPLPEKLAQIRNRTREYFDRLFA